MFFEGPALPEPSKNRIESIKNEASKKTLRKALQKLVWEPILASQTPPKSIKNHLKIDIKKEANKIAEKALKRNLSW